MLSIANLKKLEKKLISCILKGKQKQQMVPKMGFKEKFLEAWAKAGAGLISPAIAGKIHGVDRSSITRRKDIKKYHVEDNVFVSLTEIMNHEDIKPRKKRKSSDTANSSDT